MSFLLDTNVISELAQIHPNKTVVSWIEQTPEDLLFISVVTLAEIHHGVEKLTAGTKRSRLQRWVSEALPDRFAGRILPVDMAIAQHWGIVVARCASAGHPMDPMDALLAATAMVHNLTLVTRNKRHFSILQAAVINPWDHTSSAG